MAASPRFKVYTADGSYEGSLRSAELAAALASILGEGATVRDGHERRGIVWTEGAEEFEAAESYDGAATVIHRRLGGLT